MNRTIRFLASLGKRTCALVLCTALLLGLLPAMQTQAQAASSTQEMSLNKLVSWDIMRGDQYGNLEPGRAITRAEFASMLNRTFGYQKTGAQPFRDVVTSDWYYDDISIAYTAGYFEGTSRSTASPNATLTREEAATLLCRNLMLQPLSGENLSFTDGRDASSWSRGYIKAAAEEGILLGDPEGTFRPLDNITRGEVAIMLVRVIGTPVQTQGTYSNSVSGNLMVSASGVTLKNMTVTGDLYITGGVGLGYVTLDHVTVYGKIIASGAGESNKGDCSIILKNSSAPEMIIDSPSNQYVTIRSVGNTDIEKVYVRTDTYLEGKSTGRHGFQYIEVDGEEGTRLDLAGNIHEVVTMAPKSAINVGSGTVEKLTVDEQATDSTVTIAQGAVVDELNLDTGTRVTGKGDIGTANINAPGCVIEMLPDIIVIRPGITANVNGMVMDSTLAEQMSDKPRILAGYPRMDDIAPTQAQASFQANKPGKLYWAVRLSGDGPMSASDLISPPTYGGQIVKSGNLAVSEANTQLSAKISGLKLDTSYVLSAVLVDSRDDESVVKSIYFTTPDNSKPAFASGYPKTTTIEDTFIDFDVAPTKTCTLYWAIYKSGMPAPTANDFKDGSLSGAIDSGSRKVVRSEEDSIRMGSVIEDAKNALAELTEYDAYFFLTDTINDSSVVRVRVTTADRTPPEFLTNYPRISGIEAKALEGEAAINEDGKVYWAAVKHGTEYPIPSTGLTDPEAQELDKKLQIMGGMYALADGSFSAKENKSATFNIRGLEAETAYDIYFVAEDDSGNLSEIAVIENAKTLDSNAPKLEKLVFSRVNDEGTPLADTDITLVFSEDIYSTQTRMSLVEMFESGEDSFILSGSSSETKVGWEEIFRGMFTLNNESLDTPDRAFSFVLGDDGRENISVSLNEDGKTEVTFKNAALALQSGSEYQFVLNTITDSSGNNMSANTKSEVFRILDAQVDFTELTDTSIEHPDVNDLIVDKTFSMIPYAGSTANASEGTSYDVLIASDTTISFELYRRERNTAAAGNPATPGPWEQITKEELRISHETSFNWTALSLNESQGLNPNSYPKLKDMPADGYEFAIKLKSINEVTDSGAWDATVNIKAFCVAGAPGNLSNLVSGNSITDSKFNADVQGSKVFAIGNPTNFNMEIRRVNQAAPQFVQQYPRVYPGDSVTKVDFKLDRSGTLYYVVSPTMLPQNDSGRIPDSEIPDIGAMTNDGAQLDNLPGASLGITAPTASNIMNPNYDASTTRYGRVSYSQGSDVQSFNVENLQADTTYYIYFVLKGSYAEPSFVYCYQFKTSDVVSPVLTARSDGNGVASYTVKPGDKQTNVTAETHWRLYTYTTGSYPAILDYIIKSTDGTVPADQYDAVWEEMSTPGSGSSSRLNGGDPTVNADKNGTTTTVDESKQMIPGTQYVLFVAARNTLGGNAVFRAVTGLQLSDLDYPRISNISTSRNQNGDTATTYTGNVTITLNKPLYTLKTGSTIRDVIPYVAKTGNVVAASGGTATFLGANPTAGPTILSIKVTSFWENEIFFINPQYVTAGSSDSDGYFYSINGARRLNAGLTFRLERDENGKFQFVINESGAYDGLTSETQTN